MQKDLRKSSIQDYNDAITSFCNDNFESTIYLSGEISHPGISDLDFLIVDNEPVVGEKVKPYLMGGNVIICPRFLLEKVRLMESFNLKHLQGEKVAFEDPPDVFKIIEIIEWLPERILKLKHESKKHSKSLSDLLLIHKSINRSIAKVSNLTGNNYSNIKTDFARRDISTISYDEIIFDAIKFGEKSWEDFSQYVLDTKIITGKGTGVISINDYYKFDCKFEVLVLYLEKMLSIDCELSNSLSKRVIIDAKNVSFNQELEKFSFDRWDILDKNFKWFRHKKYKSGMIKYGWLL